MEKDITATTGELVETIARYFAAVPQVTTVYLFGSRASGRARAGSDVDIAVLFVPGLPELERFDAKLTFAVDLSRLTRLEFDVVDLNSAPPRLKYAVRQNNILVVNKDNAYRVAFEVKSRREYFDLKPRLSARAKAILARY